MTRTIESSITELQELKNKTNEISDFLKWKELSSVEYRKEHEAIEKKLNDIRAKVNEIVAFFNVQRDKWDVSMQQANAIQALLPSFRELKTSFDWLIKPSDFDKKLDELKPIDLWNLSPRSTFSDISLEPEELSKLKPEKLLAKTSDWIEYYQINYDGQTTILRYNPNDTWDEVALYVGVNINWLNKDDIKRVIINAERQWFQDVEMDGTASVRNIWVMASWVVAWATTLTTVWAWSYLSSTAASTAAAAVTKIPLIWKIAWGLAAWITAVWSIAAIKIIWAWAVVWWVAASMTDLDYTSEDYKSDFWSELEKLKVTKANYR